MQRETNEGSPWMLIAVDAQGGVRQMSIGGLMKGQARQRIRALAAAKGIAYTAVE